MFILRFFGLMDFLAGLALILTMLGIIPFRIVLAFALYLFIKGYIFKGDFVSTIDMVTGIFLLLMYFVALSSGFFLVISIVLILNLMQKSFFSFVTI
jgi:hypothetical protein